MAIDPEIRLHIREEIEKHRTNVREELEKQRASSNQSYAIKLVEKIVFYAVGAVSIAVLGSLIKLVIVS